MKTKIPQKKQCVFMWCFNFQNTLFGSLLGFVLHTENTVMIKFRPCAPLIPEGAINVKKEFDRCYHRNLEISRLVISSVIGPLVLFSVHDFLEFR